MNSANMPGLTQGRPCMASNTYRAAHAAFGDASSARIISSNGDCFARRCTATATVLLHRLEVLRELRERAVGDVRVPPGQSRP
ncbi:hypothetical protein SAMN05216411_103181 [Nitrosospira multiformis]|nr:hypothetical protein SAMN05216411_103181 [Nitrosospira multiformis]